MIHERYSPAISRKCRHGSPGPPERAGRPPETCGWWLSRRKPLLDGSERCVDCGVFDLGENYPQELWKKNEVLAGRASAIRWHLIGHLQTNKVKKTLPLVKMIHAVDSLKLLKMLNEAAGDLIAPAYRLPCR